MDDVLRLFCINCAEVRLEYYFRTCYVCNNRLENFQIKNAFYCDKCDEMFKKRIGDEYYCFVCCECDDDKDLINALIDDVKNREEECRKERIRRKEEIEIRKKLKDDCDHNNNQIKPKLYECKLCDYSCFHIEGLFTHYAKNKHIVRQIQKDFNL